MLAMVVPTITIMNRVVLFIVRFGTCRSNILLNLLLIVSFFFIIMLFSTLVANTINPIIGLFINVNFLTLTTIGFLKIIFHLPILFSDIIFTIIFINLTPMLAIVIISIVSNETNIIKSVTSLIIYGLAFNTTYIVIQTRNLNYLTFLIMIWSSIAGYSILGTILCIGWQYLYGSFINHQHTAPILYTSLGIR
jgi:hypothetical protein